MRGQRARGASVPLIAVMVCTACTASEPEEQNEQPTPAALRDGVDDSRYTSDLQALAVERPPGTPGWQAAQDACAAGLLDAGFTVERQDYGSGINVVGRLSGTGTQRQTVVVSAHYDHIQGCPGADDNASGLAGVLEAAQLLGSRTWTNDLVIACWDEEETGLLGSAAWAAQAKIRGEDVVASLAFDGIGYRDDRPDTQTMPAGFEYVFPDQIAAVQANDSRGDFILLVADAEGSDDHVDSFTRHAGALGLPVVAVTLTALQLEADLLGDLRRSDHASFWDEGLPGMFIGDTANFRYPSYHCRDGDDVPANLDMGFATDVVAATIGAAADALEP